jgi:quercetin dioxygenase-like cupin family protein
MDANKIYLVAELDLSRPANGSAPKLTPLFDGVGRKMVAVELANGDALTKHKATEPISVLCVAGTGIFRAGEDLENSQALRPGTLITLDAGIPHDVTADDWLRLLVTKFKQY